MATENNIIGALNKLARGLEQTIAAVRELQGEVGQLRADFTKLEMSVSVLASEVSRRIEDIDTVLASHDVALRGRTKVRRPAARDAIVDVSSSQEAVSNG